MAEVACPYSLVTPAGTLTINPVPSNQDGIYLTDVAGIDGGDVRSTVQALPQRDGAYVFGALRGAAYPTLTGIIRASTLAGRTTLMDQLKAYTESIRLADGTLRYTPSGGAARQLTVRLAAPVAINNDAGVLKSFQLALVAGNPYSLASLLTSANFPSLSATGGAWLFPFSFPFTFGDNNAGSLSVTPGGNAPAWPVITITGPLTSPVVQNVSTGLLVSLSSLALQAGDQLVIDMYNELVYVNTPANSKIGFLDLAGSTFWSLTNGVASTVRVSGSASTGATTASIAYNDTYV